MELPQRKGAPLNFDLNLSSCSAEGYVDCEGGGCLHCSCTSEQEGGAEAHGSDENSTAGADAMGGRHWYRSEARVLLVGSGADEQCGEYKPSSKSDVPISHTGAKQPSLGQPSPFSVASCSTQEVKRGS